LIYISQPIESHHGVLWFYQPAHLEKMMTFHEKRFKPVNAQNSTIIHLVLFVLVSIFAFLTFMACMERDPPADSTPTQNSPDPASETVTPSLTPTIEADDFTKTPTATMSLTPTVSLPPTFTAEDVVLVGAGDISSCYNDNDELTAQLLDDIPGIVFTTGDNAYPSGSYDQFMDCYEPTWGRHKDRTKPVPGNHEYQTLEADGYFVYFDEIEPYYAYSLGSWRIYALNSEIDVSPRSAQVSWLKAELAAHPSQCVLAYWHQPRWSSGRQYGSNDNFQTLWQILYEAGAELVINGHEHHYERFAQMNAKGQAVSSGLREIVVGTGGRSLYSFARILPASWIRNASTYGVLKLTLRADAYDWEFIPVAGFSFTDRGSTDCHYRSALQ
jgi:acid phosphatase type 7